MFLCFWGVIVIAIVFVELLAVWKIYTPRLCFVNKEIVFDIKVYSGMGASVFRYDKPSPLNPPAATIIFWQSLFLPVALLRGKK